MNFAAAYEMFEIYYNAGIESMLWGPPGVGKSSLLLQFTTSLSMGLIDFRASTRDPVALMGLPDTAGDTTRWKVPDEFPKVDRDGERGILFLDEINVASPAMQAACYGLVLDRRVGEYRLPEGWMVMCAGNRQSDRAAAQRMPSALANRLAHIDLDPDVDTTTAYFIKKDYSPILVAFLRWRPALLHDMSTPDLRAFPTPRSWEEVAKVCDLPASQRSRAVSGIVGEGAAAEFEGFVRVYQGLPSLDLVLANPNSAPVPTDPAARFAIASGLARKVKANTIANGMAYMQRLPTEFEIMFTVDAVRRDPGLSHTDAFVEWSTRNQDVILG